MKLYPLIKETLKIVEQVIIIDCFTRLLTAKLISYLLRFGLKNLRIRLIGSVW